MALTVTQLATLKADILADPVLNAQPNNSDGNFVIAAVYNGVAVPDFWVWRTRVSQAECVGDVSPDLTSWSWTIYIGRTQGERDGWRQMFADIGAVNFARDNIRQGMADIFSGAGGAAQRVHLQAIGRRRSTRIERLLAVGTGTSISPATMNFEGALLYTDVQAAREAP